MARKLGYGGLANTNGARDFTGKTVGFGVPKNSKLLLLFVGYMIGTLWH
jgi:hypothetical protein